ncbi:WXG100 family type VII secretion target [Nocardia aurantia]|uniref:WXG100 family type VII secretion target n=1 Tax=Nocardia aurantia TaxID=2585199 RepID=A0A7K0DSV3_9NOCA|nr:hypothetical protein [Nocardia aurantia]MQY27914.1 hypothetical protein [Nocardia aurantia]
MSGKVRFDVADMRQVAGELGSSATDIGAVLSTLAGAVAAHAGCWGNDEYGSHFADGDNGYLTRGATAREAIAAKVTLLEQYSKGVSDTATLFESTESGTATGFGQ